MLTSQWRQIITADLKKVLAEPLFWFILLSPFLIGWIMRHFLPYLANQLSSFSLPDYYPVILALLILTPPLYYGVILALMVLEEKDEGALLAVQVTPLTLGTFLFARVFAYTLISLPIVVLVHQMIDVVDIDMTNLLLVALAAALNVPLVVMLLSAFCSNQLEGFVMGKGMSLLILPPLAMYFVPDYWHLFCGVLPTYWPIIAYYTAVTPDHSELFFAVAITMSVILQPLVTFWLYQRFTRNLSIQ